MGGLMSRIEEVAPTARTTGKSPAMQTQSLTASPPTRPVCPAEPCATDHPHPSSSFGCTRPIRRAGYAPDPASHGFHNVLSRARSTLPRRARTVPPGSVRARRQYGFRLFRVRVPEVLRVIIEPRIVQNARDGPLTNRQRIVRVANGGRILRQFLVAGAVGGYSAF